MFKWSGHITRGYHFEVYLPENEADRTATIKAYVGYRSGNTFRERLVDKETFQLRSMPYWDVPYQATLLRSADMKKLERAERRLIKRLPKRTLLYRR